jgi:hypothetical protein
VKIVSITKSCSRKITDKAFGSIEASTYITIEENIEVDETNKEAAAMKLKELNDKLAKQVRVLTNKDLQEYLELKKQNKVY